MRDLIPTVVIPFAFASLAQHIFEISQHSWEGFCVFVTVMVFWYRFMKTPRGMAVYDSWVMPVEDWAAAKENSARKEKRGSGEFDEAA